MDDMKVANIDYSYGFGFGGAGGDPHDKNSDWSKIQKICSFAHQDACEFIVWLATLDDTTVNSIMLEEFRKVGMSEEFISECKVAAAEGFCYACFYA